MFNDKYGLTQAVLEGRKTNSRRAERSLDVLPLCYNPLINEFQFEYKDDIIVVRRLFKGTHVQTYHLKPRYKISEEVAVAQKYKDCGWNPDVLQETFVKKPTVFPDLDPISTHLGWVDLPFKYHKGWTNKMFVLADLMPNRIRITNIKVERLQDISDEDCQKEGVVATHGGYGVEFDLNYQVFGSTPSEAFASLIDRISGKGTWECNPWVFAYEFELIK